MRAVICESFGGLQSLKLGQMPEPVAAADDQVFEWIAQGKLKPYIQAVLPLEKFMTAMEMVRDRKALGRVVLQVR